MRDIITHALGGMLASLLLLGLALPIAGAQEPPRKPQIFYGKVKIDGNYFPKGTKVTLRSAGAAIKSTEVLEEGYFTMQVGPAYAYASVDFFVRGMYTGVTVDVESGRITEVPLKITDEEKPTIEIIEPMKMEVLQSEASLRVEGMVTDDIAKYDEIEAAVAGKPVDLSEDGSFSTTVDLKQGTQDVAVEATDLAGNSASETITATCDSEAPSIEELSAESPVKSKTGTVTGRITDEIAKYDEIEVTVAGKPVDLSEDGSFSVDVDLTTGTNPITVTAEDEVGNEDRGTVEIVSDTTGPTVSITSPAEGKVVKESTVTVEGTISDEVATYAELTATLNGSLLPVAGDGTFSKEISIEKGSNTVTVSSSDPAGNSGSDEVTVVRDAEKPSLTVEEPREGLNTKEAAVTVSGSVDDDVTDRPDIDLTIAGNTVSVGSDGSYSTEVSLREGSNTISVAATDGVGRSDTKSLTVTSDRTAPSLTVDAPEDGAVVTESTVTVEGSVEDEIADYDEISLTINGSSVKVESDGSFSTDLDLIRGSNTISLTAEDGVGNSSSAERTVIYDAEKPTLALKTPKKKLTTENDTITVSGTVDDDVTDPRNIKVKVAGSAVSVESDGSFSTNVSIKMGSQTITVTATDGVAKTTTKTREVERVSPTNWALYGGIAVVIAIILAAIAIWRRRYRSPGGM